MLRSMTGFGRSEVTEDGRKVSVEMKSVNHRFLEINIKLPRNLAFLEGDVRAKIKSFVTRGKIDVFIAYENDNESGNSLKYNHSLAQEYVQIYRRISGEFNLLPTLDAHVIAQCPEVITMQELKEDEAVLEKLVLAAVCESCVKITESREAEGEHLASDLLDKLDGIEEMTAFVSERSPQLIDEYKDKIRKKVEEILEDRRIDEARIAQEVVLYADRICIDEELVRLKSHIKAMRDTLNQGGAVGRRLDFLAQEMNREANTALSKTSDPEISDIAIRLKTEIEKVREQIQNIE